MVRLVTSRLHRCYSTHSLARSATLEKFSSVLHVITCVGFVSTGDWASHLLVSPSASPIPSYARTISIVLLTFVHFFDFLAVCTAHFKFYKPSLIKAKKPSLPSQTHSSKTNPVKSSSSSSKKIRKSNYTFSIITSSPDFVITFTYMFSTLVLLFSTIHYHHFYLIHSSSASSLLPPSTEQQIEQHLQVRASILFTAFTALASTVNVILSLTIPRTTSTNSNNVSPLLARLHNLVSVFFQTASVIKFISLTVLSYGVPDPAREIVRLTANLTFSADVIITLASCLNFIRTSQFLRATHFWALHDAKRLGHVRETLKKGLFGWFSSLRSGDVSDDGDLDYFDDVEYPFDDVDSFKHDEKRPPAP